MWFNSLLFAYSLLRKPRDMHEIIISLPRSWFWWPVVYRVVSLDEDYVVRYDNTSRLNKNKLRFQVPDGWTFNILLYYKGWFGALRIKELNIIVPYRLKAATKINVEIVEIKQRYML